MGTITGCDDFSASRRRALLKPPVVNCSHILYSGNSASVQKCSIQAAKPSLSHSPSHQDMVTRLPNHWCASSCHALLLLRAGGGLVDHERHLAIGDQAPVLHGAHGELGDADHVQLGQRVGDLWKGKQMLVCAPEVRPLNAVHGSTSAL
jgi:hypothetical protein